MEQRKPEWLRTRGLGARKTVEMTRDLRELNLHTVCESARCPNRGECFECGTATFIILGEVCTRRCRFCAVPKNRVPLPPDPNEPASVADLALRLNLKYVVITMVTRDDLPDGGAQHVADVVRVLRETARERELPVPAVEVLISDLGGDETAWNTVFSAYPEVLNHNIETVPRLYPEIRPQADYRRSLTLLSAAVRAGLPAKSGFMVGLGETSAEVYEILQDLRNAGVDIVTIGQYLAPSPDHAPVREYVTPETFASYREQALQLGFHAVEAGPLVRSSYHAEKTRRQWLAHSDSESKLSNGTKHSES